MYASELKVLILALRWRRDDMRVFGRIYFFVSGATVESTKDYGNEKDDENYRLGNYFLDSTEAKQVLESKEYKDFWAKVRENKIENNKHSKNGCRHEKFTLAGTIYPFTSKKEDELKVICADCGIVLDDDPRKYMIEKGLWKIK